MRAEALESTGLLLILSAAGAWLTFLGHGVCAGGLDTASRFVWLMAPLPGPLLNDSTLRVQMLSTALANKLLHLMSFGTTLVPAALSTWMTIRCLWTCRVPGFKLLLALLTFSAAFAFLVDGSPAEAASALFAVQPVPLALAGQLACELPSSAVVGECIGAPASAHVFHDWSGIIDADARIYGPVWAGQRIRMPHIRRMGYLLILLISAALLTAMAWQPAPPAALCRVWSSAGCSALRPWMDTRLPGTIAVPADVKAGHAGFGQSADIAHLPAFYGKRAASEGETNQCPSF